MIESILKDCNGLQRIATSLLRTHDENCNRLNGG